MIVPVVAVGISSVQRLQGNVQPYQKGEALELPLVPVDKALRVGMTVVLPQPTPPRHRRHHHPPLPLAQVRHRAVPLRRLPPRRRRLPRHHQTVATATVAPVKTAVTVLPTAVRVRRRHSPRVIRISGARGAAVPDLLLR